MEDIGYFGNLSTYRIKLDSGKLVEISRPNEKRSARDERDVTWDDVVYLTWDASSGVVLTE